jgi:hypothetical protein
LTSREALTHAFLDEDQKEPHGEQVAYFLFKNVKSVCCVCP